MRTKCPLCKGEVSFSRKYSNEYIICDLCGDSFRAPKVWKWIEVVVIVSFTMLATVFGLIAALATRNTAMGEGIWYKARKNSNKKLFKKEDKQRKPHSSILGENIEFESFNDILSSNSQQTQGGSKSIKNKLVGKTVRWTGSVIGVGISKVDRNLYIKFRNESSSDKPVIVYFNDSQSQKVLQLKKGDLVRYSGIITISMFNSSDIILYHGNILEVLTK